jgi:hypothetical protein
MVTAASGFSSRATGSFLIPAFYKQWNVFGGEDIFTEPTKD